MEVAIWIEKSARIYNNQCQPVENENRLDLPLIIRGS
jgi:hypothetical protein